MAGKLMCAVLHDEPTVRGAHTGLEIDVRAFSRLRERNADSTGTVMG